MQITNRKITYLVIVLCALIFFTSAGYCEDADGKEGLETYLKEIASIMTNVDTTIRAIEFNTLPIKEGIKRMDTYIGQAGLIEHPKALSKQYTMILLSFKKIRTGFLLYIRPPQKPMAGLPAEETMAGSVFRPSLPAGKAGNPGLQPEWAPFSFGEKDAAIGLIKNGTRLLKYAAKDIIAIAEKEGIRKSDKSREKGELLK